jgi:hypothetical protein
VPNDTPAAFDNHPVRGLAREEKERRCKVNQFMLGWITGAACGVIATALLAVAIFAKRHPETNIEYKVTAGGVGGGPAPGDQHGAYIAGLEKRDAKKADETLAQVATRTLRRLGHEDEIDRSQR